MATPPQQPPSWNSPPQAGTTWNQPPPQGGQWGGQPQTNNGKAIAALVLGIASCCVPYVGIVTGVIAVVMGFLARKEIRNNPNQKGDGMAITGIVLGIIGFVVYLIVIFAVGSALLAIIEACSDDPESPECKDATGETEEIRGTWATETRATAAPRTTLAWMGGLGTLAVPRPA